MAPAQHREDKNAALRRHHALNPRPQAVTDPAFSSDNPFFDAQDLVQVKYEMLRRVREDGEPVSGTALDFGFSRPSFYEARAQFEAGGLPGLLPQRPGPKRAHKLSAEIVEQLLAVHANDPTMTVPGLLAWLQERHGLRVHRRTLERALGRRQKRGPSSSP